MPQAVMIGKIHRIFARHDRNYCIFSVTGRDEKFLYYSHRSRPLRSLIFGKDFLSRLPDLWEKDDLCIECGLGLLVAGGVALDNGDLIAWHFSVEEANRVLTGLKETLGDDGHWIVLF